MTEVLEFQTILKEEAQIVNKYLSSLFQEDTETSSSEARLLSSMRYSLNNGGKRFRPVLSLLTAKALGHDLEKALPFAAAVEMIHTYSLIHDDLPSMDDDDMRRGEPTNHKVYGEAVALLAGDALLTEAFNQISSAYINDPKSGLELVRLLSEAAGSKGMVGGQIMDIEVLSGKDVSADTLKVIHQKKTGALIAVSVEGAAVACGANDQQRQSVKNFGQLVGLAFQVADDILDYDPEDIERSGFPAVLGIEQTHKSLIELSEKAMQALSELGIPADSLEKVVQFNLKRASGSET